MNVWCQIGIVHDRRASIGYPLPAEREIRPSYDHCRHLVVLDDIFPVLCHLSLYAGSLENIWLPPLPLASEAFDFVNPS